MDQVSNRKDSVRQQHLSLSGILYKMGKGNDQAPSLKVGKGRKKMAVPRNFYLKGFVDISKVGQIQTLFKESISSENIVLASCELSPDDVFVLVERLAWTSVYGSIEYFLDNDDSHITLTYPFSSFWETITNSSAVAQYSDEYAKIFEMTLSEKLALRESRYPHYARLKLPIHQMGAEYARVRGEPHNSGISSFDCRSDIISEATYIEGMLHKVISNSNLKSESSIKGMTYHEKICYCRERSLLSPCLLEVVIRLKDLRNEAAHEFSFDDGAPVGDFLTVNPAGEQLILKVKEFVDACEQRYSLSVGRIERFRNCVRMLAGEINEKANLSQKVVIGKQYPKELSSYFYG